MDMIFTDKTLIDILDFLLRIDAWIEVDGYSHEFWKSMKGWSEGKSDERIGIAVLRFSDEQILKDMENVMLSFIFGSMKHTSAPLKRGVRSIRKKSWFNFQNY
jgi:very-short-patch-repair endonuclease